MRRLLGMDHSKTFKPLKKHRNEKQKKMHQMTIKTLGSGNLAQAVALPKGEDLNEWLALNTVDFFNEMSLLYGVIANEAAERFTKVGEGFPDGFEYRWQDEEHRRPIRCSAPDYVDYVMTWVEGNLQNEHIFPSRESTPFPTKFMTHVRSIFKRLFRVFAIIYTNHLKDLKEIEADKHLNTCFKHFVFFFLEFNLVASKEIAALPVPTKAFHGEYMKSKSKMREAEDA